MVNYLSFNAETGDDLVDELLDNDEGTFGGFYRTSSTTKPASSSGSAS